MAWVESDKFCFTEFVMTIKDYYGFEINAERESPDDVHLTVIRNSDYWILGESYESGSVRECIESGKLLVDDFWENPEDYKDLKDIME